jgi:hypothetical protein
VVKATSLLPLSRKKTLPNVWDAGSATRLDHTGTGMQKNFLPLEKFIIQGVQTAESIGRIKVEFGMYGWKKRPELGHYTTISVQRIHEQRNTLTGHLSNNESISGFLTHRTEIQTANSSTSVDVCLFNSCFFLTYCIQERIHSKKKQGQGI